MPLLSLPSLAIAAAAAAAAVVAATGSSAGASAAVHRTGRPFHRQRDQFIERLRSPPAGVEPPSDADLPPAQYFQQVVDHFDAFPVTSTWPQRFWVNASLFTPGSSAPVFVYVEGEGAGSPYGVLYGEHMELAAQFGALVVGLEHRGYGASVGFAPDMSTASLRLLSSHQAVGDVSTFLTEYVFPTYGVGPFSPTKNKVVTFGGSYSGALSAFIRLRLPHLVHAALATSAPVQALTDFVGYNEVVQSSLAMPFIGGSDACVAATRAAFTVMDAAFAAGGPASAAMAKSLNSCAPLTGANDTMWAASNYGGAVQGMVQYNLEGGSYNVQQYCQQMTDESRAPIENLVLAMASLNGPACVDNSYSDFVAMAANTTANPAAQGVGIRSWTWQTCTEVGFYQTCEDRDACPLSLYMTLDSNTQQCADLFGPEFTFAAVDARVGRTNALLGGAMLSSSNVVFVNGDVDPWHLLSAWNASSNPALMPSVFIHGTAHCRNMQSSSPNDPPALVAARKQINDYLAAMLAQ